MNLAVCSLSIGKAYKKAVQHCTRSLKAYCTKHNYPLITDESLANHDRDYMWSKVPLMREHLPNYDYIVWIDGDMTIMNDEITLEHIIEMYLGNKETIMSIDCGDQINTGFWIVKNTEAMRNLLDLISNLPELAGNYHEQGVFNELYKKNLFDLQRRSRIISEPCQRIFNASVCNYVIGDFIMHFLGIRNLETLEFAAQKYHPTKHPDEKDSDFKWRMAEMKRKHATQPNQRYVSTPPIVRTTICTFYTGDKYSEDVVKHGQLSMELYCKRNNYSFFRETENLVDGTDLPAHWVKMALLLKMMKESKNDDYIVWMDADVMIMNHSITIESIIEDHMNGKDFLLCRDVSGEINTGVIIVRNTDYAKSVLELNLALPELRYRGCEDQDTFNQLYIRNLLNLQDHASILSPSNQNIMNCCVGCYHWGDFLIHFFSLGKDGLKSAFDDFYPFQKDGEHLSRYMYRKKWLKAK